MAAERLKITRLNSHLYLRRDDMESAPLSVFATSLLHFHCLASSRIEQFQHNRQSLHRRGMNHYDREAS